MIKINNVSRTFNKGRSNEVKAVNDVTITFPDKGIVTLFGHSGSGKTTILNIVGGLDNPSKGEVLINGKPIKDFDLIRNQKIGYVFQNYNLFTNLSVFENVAFVLKMLGISDEKFIKERVEYTLKLVNMSEFKRKKANELSGGQQQRVAIARALVKNPDYIIADEPTGNIDAKNKIEVMNILRKISEHKLVVLVTHEENISKYYSDRIITLVDGKIVSDEANRSGVVNEFQEENKIYLDDLNPVQEINEENVSLKYYGDNKNKLDVRLIFKDNTLYIESNSNARIDLLNSNSRVEIVNEKKIDQKFELDQTDFEYENLQIDNQYLGKRKLFNFLTSVKVSFSRLFNKSLKGKFLIMALILSGLLIGIGAIRFSNLFISTVPESQIYDKDLYSVESKVDLKNFQITTSDDLFMIAETNLPRVRYQMVPIGNSRHTLELDAITAPVDEISERELIYGSMPSEALGIVISKGLADSIILEKETMGLFNIKDLIGRMIIFKDHQVLKISGISNRTSKVIFLDRKLAKSIIAITTTLENRMTSMTVDLMPVSFISHELIDGQMPINFSNHEIEVVISEKLYQSMKDSTLPFSPFYIEHSLPDSTMADYFKLWGVESQYKMLVTGVIKTKSDEMMTAFSTTEVLSKFNDEIQNIGSLKTIFTTNQQIIENLSKDYKVQNLYQNQQAENLNQRRTGFASILTFSGFIFLLSAVGYYFLNKSEMLSHIYQINVYRSLGVKKWEIIKLFVVDTIVLTSVSSIIGYLLTISVYISLASGGLGELGIIRVHTPTLLIGFILVYLINIISGIIPVLILLRKSPAEITKTFDF